MLGAGCQAWFPTERLAVMGLVEVLGRLPELLRIRAGLRRRLLSWRPDAFVGIDAPDFNLPLERRLHQAGIATVHYVSPSVWAWRRRRVRGIARSVDLMLTLLPFEAQFYREHRVPVRFVGHPLADTLVPVPRETAREPLGVAVDRPLLALLPGSRHGELQRLGALFLRTAAWCAERVPGLQLIAPMASPELAAQFQTLRGHCAPQLDVHVLQGQAQRAMAAADAVLVASGTATLEALLLQRPMVVAYRLAPSTYRLVKWLRLVRLAHFSLPNLLAGRALVPEFLQDEATPERLGAALIELLREPQAAARLEQAFSEVRLALRRNASRQAADAVLELLEARAARQDGAGAAPT